MRCEKAKRRMALYAGGDLSARKARKLQAHLECCSSCRKEADEYRAALDRVRNAAKQAKTPDWDEAAWSGTMARIAAEKPLGERRFGALAPRWAFASAGLGVVLIAALALYFFKDTLFRPKEVIQASLPAGVGLKPSEPDLKPHAVDPKEREPGHSGSVPQLASRPITGESTVSERDSGSAVSKGRFDPASVQETSAREHIAAAHPALESEAARKVLGAETPVPEQTAAGLPQDVLSVTFVSQETGLQIAWFFHKDFDWKGDEK